MDKMLERNFKREAKGFAPLIALIILVAVAVAAGAGIYLYRSAKSAAKSGATGQEAGKSVGTQPSAVQAGDEIGALQVTGPGFEVPSTSALPSLEASAFNLTSASLPSTGVFRDFTAKTDTSYSYKLDVAVPEVQLDVPTQPATPAGDNTGSGGGTSGGSSGTGGQGTPSAANCAQFSAMPSAQYCSAAGDPNGIALCQACKAAGF